ncbi:MAG: cytochrome c biogenesis protein ResB [Elusimicrobiota bacterium]
MKKTTRKALSLLASMHLTVALLVVLMLLVVLCTLHQVELGTYGSVLKYMRGFFVYAALPGLGVRVPVFPAGGLVGLGLIANLLAVLFSAPGAFRQRAGFWLIHTGLVLLVLGEFMTGMFSVETQMTVEEGQTVNYTENRGREELVLIDHSLPEFDEVYSMDAAAMREGRTISHPRMPLDFKVIAHYPNAKLERRPPDSKLPPSKANRGVGPGVTVWPLAPAAEEQGGNQRTAYVEATAGGKPLGTWLVSAALAQPQHIDHAGGHYSLLLRPKRHYLPYSITLKDFRHDVYPGTSIPKNFASLIQLRHPQRGEDREVLIYMNHPLRYAGKAFFQASYGKGDTLSVLQVVENPGWLLPYVSFLLVTLGLLFQFAIQMRAFSKIEGGAG